MQPAGSTSFRGVRAALAAVGLTTALLASAYLWTFTSGISFTPLVLCLHRDDVACSNDYFLGRDHAEHAAQLTGLLVGLAGLTLIAASGLWSRHLRATTPD